MSINEQLERLEKRKAALLEKLENERAVNALAVADVLEQFLIKNPDFVVKIKESANVNNGVNTVKRFKRWFNAAGIKQAIKNVGVNASLSREHAGSALVKQERPVPPTASVNAAR